MEVDEQAQASEDGAADTSEDDDDDVSVEITEMPSEEEEDLPCAQPKVVLKPLTARETRAALKRGRLPPAEPEQPSRRAKTPTRSRARPTPARAQPERARLASVVVQPKVTMRATSPQEDGEPTGGMAGLTIRRALEFVHGTQLQTASRALLESRLAVLEEAYQKFKADYQRAMSAKATRAQRRQFPSGSYTRMEDHYIEARATMSERIRMMMDRSYAPSAASTRSEDSGASELMRARLVELEMQAPLPAFDGNLLQWAQFREAFMHDVHQSKVLTPRQKLRKLQGAVTGTAKRILGDWAVRDESYEPAWHTLCQAYDRDYHTIHALLREVHTARAVTQPDFESYHGLLSTMRNAHRRLLSYLSHEEAFEYMLMYELEIRLDSVAREQWEMTNSTSARPTLRDMEEFIERRARSGQAALNASRATTSGGPRGRPAPNHRAATTTGTSSAPPQRTTALCRLCRLPHALYRCQEFLSQRVNRRRELTIQWNLCVNCFRAGHQAAQCQAGECRRCPGQKHNSVLCPVAEAELNRTRAIPAAATATPSTSMAAVAATTERDESLSASHSSSSRE